MDRELNYISLQEATKFCDYTQEYLSLRARQGIKEELKSAWDWIKQKSSTFEKWIIVVNTYIYIDYTTSCLKND